MTSSEIFEIETFCGTKIKSENGLPKLKVKPWSGLPKLKVKMSKLGDVLSKLA